MLKSFKPNYNIIIIVGQLINYFTKKLRDQHEM
ncbi:MAG: hypothetical protein PWQ15_1556 [Methanobacterium sp.]|jgi:hypothetical protein|nr:hypothetical protein [Methanobacterium sp.]